MKKGWKLPFVFYALGLALWFGFWVLVFRVLSRMRTAAAVGRALSDFNFSPREVYNESLKAMERHADVWRNAVLGERPGKTQGDVSDEPLAALFFFVNRLSPEGLGELKPDWFLSQRLKPIPSVELHAIRFFCACAELSDKEFQKVRRRMLRRQRGEADKIRSTWRGRISSRMERIAQTKADHEEGRHQAKLWLQERASPVRDQDLTNWLCAQSPDVWHELSIGVEWMGDGAAELVPFVEWLVAQPELDRSTALLLLAQAVGEGIDAEPYEQHDCARNQAWMKTLHEGLKTAFYTQIQLAIPPAGRQMVEALFEPEHASGWKLPHVDLDKIPTRPRHSEWVFIYNHPVESFEAWKDRRFA